LCFEAKAAAALDHPNICTVFEVDEAEGTIFLAMAFVEGPTVKEKIAQRPLKLEAVLEIAAQTAEGLRCAHQRGIVHRDIKPANIMVVANGPVKITDFGIARMRGTGDLTQTGMLLGSPKYMSPEQVIGKRADHRSDIFSLGVILYEMLCGVPPFQAPTRDAVLSKQLTETPTPMRRRRRAVPASVEAAVALALYKQPELRPLMQDVLNRLWAEAHGPVRRWKRKAAIVGGTIVTASIAAIVVWGLVGPRLLAPRPLAQSPAALSPAAPSPDRGPTAPLAQPTPPPQQALAPARPAPATERATVGAQPTSSIPAGGPVTETRTAPPVVPATPAPHAAPRSTPAPPPPSPASPPPRAERRVEPRTPPQAPAGAASERRPASPSNTDTDDPGAIIDWLLKRSSERDK